MECYKGEAKVTSILLDKYILKDKNNNVIEAVLTGNMKKRHNVLVGDNVVYEKSYDKYVITDILERKNELIRPPVANIDNLVIVISIDNPKPDYLLLDKEIILSLSKNITPIICVNKVDLDNKDEVKYIDTVYKKLGIKVIYTSVKENTGIDELKKEIKGSVSAFSGNSGVGKSSLSQKIIDIEDILIGDIGEKTKKGKHTTKSVKLYNIDEDTYILDTPGFSSYELFGVSYKELKNYYTEFIEYNCDYDDCNHVNESEKVCSIKNNVLVGNIDKNRYERYVYLYKNLKEKEDRKYK